MPRSLRPRLVAVIGALADLVAGFPQRRCAPVRMRRGYRGAKL